ncbi:helix-turn-helix transcriptional regulator, partial [Oscillibacter sp.]
MVTMAQRIVELRSERGLSRPALSAALGFPRMAVEKFETGRQTPTQDQQEKLASFFGVSVFYLRGENNDRVRMDDW